MISRDSFILKKINNQDIEKKKFNLILGLDTCILYYDIITSPTTEIENKNKNIFYIETTYCYKIFLRNGIIDFLLFMEKYFNIYIFTLSNHDFTYKTCKKINDICKKEVISEIIYKNKKYNEKRRKSLYHINNADADIDNTIIIDTNYSNWSYWYHKSIIQIPPCHFGNPKESSPFAKLQGFIDIYEIFLICDDLKTFFSNIKRILK
jgi:hypothetical protein